LTATPETFNKFEWKKRTLPLLRGLSAGQLRVLDSIFNHSDGQGRKSHPGRVLIGEETGLTVRQVGRNLDALKARELIECVNKGNRKIKLNDVYELRIPSLIKDVLNAHKGPLEVPPTDPMNRSRKGSVPDPFSVEKDIGDVLPLVGQFETVEERSLSVSQPERTWEGHPADVPLGASREPANFEGPPMTELTPEEQAEIVAAHYADTVPDIYVVSENYRSLQDGPFRPDGTLNMKEPQLPHQAASGIDFEELAQIVASQEGPFE
jgi:hypothetical protein